MAFLTQFKRKYNFYFLFVTLLQAVEPIQTVSFGLALLPLIFVFGVSIVREFIEEIRRGRQDRVVNGRQTLVLRDGKFCEIKWKELQVGDLVMVHQDEYIPADMVLLRSSDHHANAYIQTMALDGERALKQRQALTEVADEMKAQKVLIPDLKFYLTFGEPNSQIYQFDGDLNFQNPEIKTMNLTNDQFLQRGSKLANTDWAIGIIVYAGHDTKLMRSMIKGKAKISHSENAVNQVFLTILLELQLSLALILAIGGIIVYKTELELTISNGSIDGPWYLWKDEGDYDQSAILYFIIIFFRHMLLFGWLLPILSLVSIEVIKIFQSLFIYADAGMYSLQHDQGCKVFSISLGEELGVINNIFTDKTGTLTANEMIMKGCAIGDIKYDKNILEEDLEHPEKESEKVLEYIQKSLQEDESSLEKINSYSKGTVKLSKQKDYIHYFWLALTVCHEVISISKKKQEIKKRHDDDVLILHQNSSITPKKPSTSKVDSSNIEEGSKRKLKGSSEEDSKEANGDCSQISEHDIEGDEELVYHGMSPDEITLVEAAKEIGYEFRYRTNNQIGLKIDGQAKVFTLLQLFKFSSERKRMTIVIQDPDDTANVIIITKGADDIMKTMTDEEKNKLDTDFAHEFSMQGYRTLMVGIKVISKSGYDSWESKFSSTKEDEDKILNLQAELEKGQVILGTTALEDKLQENVHQCIEEFRRADIKVWMITGDKLETAESVGISCRLLQDERNRVFLTAGQDDEETIQNAREILEHVNSEKEAESGDNGLGIQAEEDSIDEEKKVNPNDISKTPGTPDHLNNKGGHSFINGDSDSNTKHAKKQSPPQSNTHNDGSGLTLEERKEYVENLVKYSGFNRLLKPKKEDPLKGAKKNYELVVEGRTLDALLREENKEVLKDIIQRCSSVIVCRATPKQKADVLDFGKEIDPKQISLAIGDGGNDVSMIKKADVGIGIYGKEGYQAVSASDYAIGEFQFLRRLLFVHGRNNHRRFKTFFIHMLTKNLIFCMGTFLFAFYNLFSGASYYEPTYAVIFNIMTMNLVIIIFAIYETDIHPDLRDRVETYFLPYLYAESRVLEMFSIWKFNKWFIYCGIIGALNFYINFGSYYLAVDHEGRDFGQWQWSFTSYCAIMAIHLTIMSQYVRTWSICKFIFFFLHVTLFFPVFVMLYHVFAESQLVLYVYWKFWLNLLVITGVCALPFFVYRRTHLLYFPYLIDIVLSKSLDEKEAEEKLSIKKND